MASPATLSAFQLGQVDELIITGSPDTLKSVQELPEDASSGDAQVITSNPGGAGDEGQLKLSVELITRAQQTAARVRFIEEPRRSQTQWRLHRDVRDNAEPVSTRN